MIAKQSQRTADESKNVAVETRRDSTSMKTIAGLTMVYLPSTFVATIFSTGFFNVTGSGSGLIVSAAIWKFIAVAAILTAITISVWVYLNKRGVPTFLHWTQIASEQDKDKSKRRPLRQRYYLTCHNSQGTEQTIRCLRGVYLLVTLLTAKTMARRAVGNPLYSRGTSIRTGQQTAWFDLSHSFLNEERQQHRGTTNNFVALLDGITLHAYIIYSWYTLFKHM